VSGSNTTVIRLALPSLQALALAHFVKRVDFNTVARLASVAISCDDGKAEADLVWLALIELRRAMAEAGAARRDMPASDPAAIASDRIVAAVLPPAKSDASNPVLPDSRRPEAAGEYRISHFHRK
jgi:hypothetical protein